MNPTSSPQAGQLKSPGNKPAPELFRWILTALLNRFPWMKVSRAPRRMQLVETLNLGGSRQLLLVMCDGQKYLVGAGLSVNSLTSPRGVQAHQAIPPLLKSLPHDPLTELTQ
jgi:hypothetical protein